MAIYNHRWPYMAISPLGAQNCERIRKTKVSRFLPFYPLILAFQTFSCIPWGRSRRDLSIHMKNSWFHALWLGIQVFLWFIVEFAMKIHGNPCLPSRAKYACNGHVLKIPYGVKCCPSPAKYACNGHVLYSGHVLSGTCINRRRCT